MKKIMKVSVLLLIFFAFASCGGNSDDSGSDASGSNGENTKSVVGCATLEMGTTCTANSVCDSRFYCRTGQGSDNDCSSGCSCVEE